MVQGIDQKSEVHKSARGDAINMKTLTSADYQNLTRDARVLSRDEHGDKVLLLADGRVMKLFRRKRWLSSALFSPYAVRFARASAAMRQRGIPSVCVEAIYRIPASKRHAVVYPLLAGKTLRSVLCDAPGRLDDFMAALAALLAQLHERGVYFRAMHFGNVLVCEDDQSLALLDISETRLFSRPVSPRLRAASFRALRSYREDANLLDTFGPTRFLTMYLQRTAMKTSDQRAFLNRLGAILPVFAPKASVAPDMLPGARA